MFFLIPIAFVSGALTVFSPCVLPILPIILTSGIDGKIWRMRGIIAGLIVSFTIASLLLATIVSVLGVPVDTIRTLAVTLLVLLGLSMVFPMMGGNIQVYIERYWQVRPAQHRDSGFGGGFLAGISLGMVWTPCSGPILATVATLAAVHSLSPQAVGIALAYALGTGTALYAIAIGGSAMTTKLGVVKRNSQTIRQVYGIVILLTALFIFSGFDRKLQAWTLDNLPTSWTQIATNVENQLHADTSLNRLKEQKSIVRKVSLANDFTGAKVKKEDVLQGCFGQDCIPSIDTPIFESVQNASWLRDSDVIFAINYKGVQRAYPQRILNWHEIVNDTVAGDPIVITFCPLCGSALAFKRNVDGVITEFGVSGKLHNSDLVMYDRYEGNLWQQVTGEGIVGPAARRNEVLKQVPIITTTWGAWKKEHVNTEVLSRNTGHVRNYDQYPYGTYEQDDQIYFGVKGLNKKLHIKTVVYGVEVNGKTKAYPANVLDEHANIEDTLGNSKLKLEKMGSGEVTVTNLQTNEKIIPLRLFWFAWAAFHPDTELYEGR